MGVRFKRTASIALAMVAALGASACSTAPERTLDGRHPAYYHDGGGDIGPPGERLRLRSGEFYFRSTREWMGPLMPPSKRRYDPWDLRREVIPSRKGAGAAPPPASGTPSPLKRRSPITTEGGPPKRGYSPGGVLER